MSTAVMWIGGGMLAVAAILMIVRIERGPSMLDRTITLDMLVGAVMVALAMWSAATGRTDLVNVLMVLALVGFVGSVTLARFAGAEPDDDDPVRADPPPTQSARLRAALERDHWRRGPGREDAVRRADPEGDDAS